MSALARSSSDVIAALVSPVLTESERQPSPSGAICCFWQDTRAAAAMLMIANVFFIVFPTYSTTSTTSMLFLQPFLSTTFILNVWLPGNPRMAVCAPERSKSTTVCPASSAP